MRALNFQGCSKLARRFSLSEGSHVLTVAQRVHGAWTSARLHAHSSSQAEVLGLTDGLVVRLIVLWLVIASQKEVLYIWHAMSVKELVVPQRVFGAADCLIRRDMQKIRDLHKGSQAKKRKGNAILSWGSTYKPWQRRRISTSLHSSTRLFAARSTCHKSTFPPR